MICPGGRVEFVLGFRISGMLGVALTSLAAWQLDWAGTGLDWGLLGWAGRNGGLEVADSR